MDFVLGIISWIVSKFLKVWNRLSNTVRFFLIVILILLVVFSYVVYQKNAERREVERHLEQWKEAQGMKDIQKVEAAKSDAIIKEQTVNAYAENVNAIRNSNSNVNRTANDLERILKEGK